MTSLCMFYCKKKQKQKKNQTGVLLGARPNSRCTAWVSREDSISQSILVQPSIIKLTLTFFNTACYESAFTHSKGNLAQVFHCAKVLSVATCFPFRNLTPPGCCISFRPSPYHSNLRHCVGRYQISWHTGTVSFVLTLCFINWLTPEPLDCLG